MCSCVYVCACVAVCVCIYVRMYVHMYVCIYVCMCVYMYVHIYVCMCVCAYVCSLPYVMGKLQHLKFLGLDGNPIKSIRRDVINVSSYGVCM